MRPGRWILSNASSRRAGVAVALAMTPLALVGCREGDAAIVGAATNSPPAARPSQAPAPAPEHAAPGADVESAPFAKSAPAVPAGDRIYSRARFLWIYPQPHTGKPWIGYVGLGGSVPVKGGVASSARVGGPSPARPMSPWGGGGAACNAWYAVEPYGYACTGIDGTLDSNDPVLVELQKNAPDLGSPWPYRYAESMGTPRYLAIPAPDEQRAREPDLAWHRGGLLLAKLSSALGDAVILPGMLGVDVSASPDPEPAFPGFRSFVREARSSVQLGSTVAYQRTFDVGGRGFALTSDYAVVPRDRLRPYPESRFRGVELSGDIALPLAYFRTAPRPRFRVGDGGRIEPTRERFAVQEHLAIRDEVTTQDGVAYVVGVDGVTAARKEDATVLRVATRDPFSPEERRTKQPAERFSWLEISVYGGWAVAYEDRTPVYATLIAPGRGGTPFPGKDAVSTASTPVGAFRVDGKFRTATMVSSTDPNLVHADVQYVQNFHGPHALHGAYWHDAWGELKSGGCVNFSPIDSKWMFDWTSPRVPEGWHGMKTLDRHERPTRIVIHQ